MHSPPEVVSDVRETGDEHEHHGHDGTSDDQYVERCQQGFDHLIPLIVGV